MMVEYFPVNSWYASGSLALCSAFRIGDPGRWGDNPVYASFGGNFLTDAGDC